MTAVDVLTGKTIWTTEKMFGYTAEVVPVYQKDMLVFLTLQDNRIKKDKPDIYALKMSTGELLWKNEYTEKVDLYGIEKKKRGGASAMLLGSGGGASDRFDLKGENPPTFDDNSLYMTYAGLHRYSLADGKLIWKTLYDVTDGSLKNTNGQAITDGDVIYTSANGIIRAIDKNSGTIKWTTKDFGKGGIAEMQMHGDVIYGRMGGQFFSGEKRRMAEKIADWRGCAEQKRRQYQLDLHRRERNDYEYDRVAERQCFAHRRQKQRHRIGYGESGQS